MMPTSGSGTNGQIVQVMTTNRSRQNCAEINIPVYSHRVVEYTSVPILPVINFRGEPSHVIARSQFPRQQGVPTPPHLNPHQTGAYFPTRDGGAEFRSGNLERR